MDERVEEKRWSGSGGIHDFAFIGESGGMEEWEGWGLWELWAEEFPNRRHADLL